VATFEVIHTTTRLARIDAADRESAKRRFAAYVLYGETAHVAADVETGFGDDAELAPYAGAPPATADLRAWLARRDAESERFEPALFEDPSRRIDAYLRLLAANDPWRLEGHGSLGRALSAVPAFAVLATCDGRIRYRFEATTFLDYLRADVALAIDPARPGATVRVANLVDVAALHDDGLRQIASSYDVIARECALTAPFASGTSAVAIAEPYGVVFDEPSWRAYVDHRREDPERFLPPAGWTSAFPTYGDDLGM